MELPWNNLERMTQDEDDNNGDGNTSKADLTSHEMGIIKGNVTNLSSAQCCLRASS